MREREWCTWCRLSTRARLRQSPTSRSTTTTRMSLGTSLWTTLLGLRKGVLPPTPWLPTKIGRGRSRGRGKMGCLNAACNRFVRNSCSAMRLPLSNSRGGEGGSLHPITNSFIFHNLEISWGEREGRQYLSFCLAYNRCISSRQWSSPSLSRFPTRRV